jgi:phosphoribosylpyrophosphate synthetase
MNVNPSWKLVLCSGAEHLEGQLQRKGFSTYKSNLNYDGSRMFANGDVYIAYPEAPRFSGKRVCVLQSLTSSGEFDRFPFSTQDRLIELLQTVRTLRETTVVSYESGERKYIKCEPPEEIVVLCLHMAFSKQDGIYRTGECNSARLALDLIYESGASRIITIDPHVPLETPWIQPMLQEGRLIILSMYKMFADKLLSQGKNNDIYFISTPGKKRTSIGKELKEISKERISTHQVLLMGHVDDVSGKRICLLDDMVISGTTIKNARKLFINQGAAEVVCWITHALPLFPPANEDNLRALVEEYEEKVFVSNTIRSKTFEFMYPYCMVSCVPLIVDCLNRL